jgi:hypothetical protein
MMAVDLPDGRIYMDTAELFLEPQLNSSIVDACHISALATSYYFLMTPRE